MRNIAKDNIGIFIPVMISFALVSMAIGAGIDEDETFSFEQTWHWALGGMLFGFLFILGYCYFLMRQEIRRDELRHIN